MINKIKKMYKTSIVKHLFQILALVVLVGCNHDNVGKAQEEYLDQALSPSGVKTSDFDKAQFENIIFVNMSSEVDLENGTKEAPYRSIIKAVENARSGIQNAIIVAAGEYAEGTIHIKEGISIYGGFSINDWSRDIIKNKSILLGKDGERILVASDNSTIDGFVFSKAAYQGKGAAIYCEGTSPTITNNVFYGNIALGPSNWNPKFWHETANNGGAIYGINGASPLIESNIFFNNRTENGRGAAVAFDNKCEVIIRKNVFLNNVAGISDPMRSSDGGAISIFNWCKAEISDNIFLGNKALSKNDGGSIFIALWSSAVVKNNIIVNSESGDDAGAIFVGGQEHRYGGAELDPIPPKESFYVTIDNNQLFGNKNSSMNSGAIRFTMESRGEFTNNILAFNNGVYFQRSEVAVKNNLILDNFLFIETKEGLKQGIIENNVIWGDFQLETPVRVVGNKIRDGFLNGQNNSKEIPEIKNDSKNYPVISSTIGKDSPVTHIYIGENYLEKNELVNRVVRAGDSWGIIQSNSKNDLTIWGNLYGINNIQILPSFKLLENPLN